MKRLNLTLFGIYLATLWILPAQAQHTHTLIMQQGAIGRHVTDVTRTDTYQDQQLGISLITQEDQDSTQTITVDDGTTTTTNYTYISEQSSLAIENGVTSGVRNISVYDTYNYADIITGQDISIDY